MEILHLQCKYMVLNYPFQYLMKYTHSLSVIIFKVFMSVMVQSEPIVNLKKLKDGKKNH